MENVTRDLVEFTRLVSAMCTEHPIFRRRRFFDGLPVRRRGAEGRPDISWFTPDGSEMSEEDWDSGFGKAEEHWRSTNSDASG